MAYSSPSLGAVAIINAPLISSPHLHVRSNKKIWWGRVTVSYKQWLSPRILPLHKMYILRQKGPVAEEVEFIFWGGPNAPTIFKFPFVPANRMTSQRRMMLGRSSVSKFLINGSFIIGWFQVWIRTVINVQWWSIPASEQGRESYGFPGER